MKIKNESAANGVCNYVIQTEEKDFMENPSKDHVYYAAVWALDGKRKADQLLKTALEAQ